MKRWISLLLVVLLFALLFTGAAAASSTPEVDVAIVSPQSFEGLPAYHADFQIRITNLTDHELRDLTCYLIIVDMSHGMSIPVDEFGADAYQVRQIESIPAGSSVTVTIPVSIFYVGVFKFTASVLNEQANYTVTSDPVTANMLITSQMNKTLVLAVAVAVPLALGLTSFTLTRRKKCMA